LTPPAKFKQIEERLRTSLQDWKGILVKLRADMEKQVNEKGVVPEPWFVAVDGIKQEIEDAMTDFRTIREDLEVAKIEADYGSVLVGSWPANHYLDRMAYIGGAMIGVGGAVFVYSTSILQQNPISIVPSLVPWSVGVALLAHALYGLADWEREKFDFFAWKLAVPEKYRPSIFRKSPLSERLDRFPEQFRAKLRKLSAEKPPT
jgi:hypothetical protein